MNTHHNPALKGNAQKLRRTMTKEERHLWYDFLKQLPLTVHRQKVFGSYIADFYNANPDVILTNVNYVENPTEEIMNRTGWEHITAVKDKAVYSIDSNSSSRPTQHIIKALKEMAKAVYPDEYKDK